MAGGVCRRRAGTTLIEGRVGGVLLAVVSLCSSLLLSRTHTILVQQAQRRVAVRPPNRASRLPITRSPTTEVYITTYYINLWGVCRVFR